MKKTILKRLFACVLCATLIFVVSGKQLVKAASTTKLTDHVSMVGDAITGQLWDGVNYERMHIQSERAGSYSSTDAGLIYDWDSIVVTAANNPAIKVASWGLSKVDGYQQGTTADIAKDYEKKHPGYTVLAAINGDFFANASYTTSTGKSMTPTFEPINCWVADGGITLKKGVLANPHHAVVGIRLDRTYTYQIGSHWNSDGTIAQTGDAMQRHGENVPEFTDTLMYHCGDDAQVAVVTSGALREDAVNIILPGSTNVNVAGYTVYKAYMDRYARPNDGFQGKYFIGYNYPGHAYNIDYTGLYINARSVGAQDLTTIASVEAGYCYIVTKIDSVKAALNTRATSFTCQYDLAGDVWGDVNSTIGTVIPFLIEGEKTQYVSNSNNYLNDPKPKSIIAFSQENEAIFYFMGPGPLSKATGTAGPSSIEMCEMLEKYGAYNAFCLDGGGSATICIKNFSTGGFDTLNTGTDGSIRAIGNALLMIVENPNLGPTEIHTTSAIFGQSKAMVESTLKSAKLHMNNKTYDLTNGEVEVTGLTKNTTYKYYFEYTFENERGTFTSSTHEESFKTLAEEVEEYTYKFVVDGKVVKEETAEAGTKIVAPADPEKEGYEFAGWDKEFDTLEENITITAKFTKVGGAEEYTYQFVVDGEVVKEETAEAGTKIVAPEDPVKKGYKFTGWDKDFDTLEEDIIITAEFKKEQTQSSGMSCNFGAYAASMVAGFALVAILLKKKH